MNSKKWLWSWFKVILIIGLIPYILIYFFLVKNYENNTFKEIVSRQIKNNSIYGTALNQNSFLYKLELINNIKPKVIVLGSSRVMQFRKESFNTSFVNAGGGMNHLNEGYDFLNSMYKIHKPEYIILGLDFWWFNDDFNQPKSFAYHKNTGNTIDFHKISKTITWLIKGKIKFSLRTIFDNNKIVNQYTNYDNLGFDAIATSDGFRKDGSRCYTKIITGIKPSKDIKFKNTFKRIKNGDSRFQYGDILSKNRLKIFQDILTLAEKNKTKIIIIIPPVSNKVFHKMQTYNYKFIKKLSTYISLLKVENYNYHKDTIITSNNCEYIDGFHGGDIIYKRILRDIYKNKSTFSDYININQVEKDIKKFKGKVLTILPTDVFKKDEIDFLQLGCKKEFIKIK